LDSEPLSVSRTFYRKLKSLCTATGRQKFSAAGKQNSTLSNRLWPWPCFRYDCALS